MSYREDQLQLNMDELQPGDVLAEDVSLFDFIELEQGRKLTIGDIRQLKRCDVGRVPVKRNYSEYSQPGVNLSSPTGPERKAS